jgi:hypothetical protein
MQFLGNMPGTEKDQKPGNGVDDKTRYRCVEVLPGGIDCCQAANDILGKRFLRAEIPALPLATCDAEVCRCSYELLDDRRTSHRRASDAVGDSATLFFEADNRHRSSSGRRHDD